MEGREIPGFYYDREKKKYFKIQPNHVATASAIRYSKTNVKKAKQKENLQKAETAQRTAVRQQLVQRSKILQAPTAAGVGLTREVSQEVRPLRTRDDVASAYGAGLYKAWRVNMDPCMVKSFVADPATHSYFFSRSYYAGGSDTQIVSSTTLSAPLEDRKSYFNMTLRPRGNSDLDAEEMITRTMKRSMFNDLAVFHNEITSISLSPSRTVLATTMGGAVPPFITVFPLRGGFVPNEPRDQIEYRLPLDVDVWDSSANPFIQDASIFATACSDKVVILSSDEDQWTMETLLETETDAFAVQWMTPTLLATGLRAGAVHLSDYRSGGSVLRLQHPGSITGIRSVSAESLVVCGLEDALAMYDLRMPIVDELRVARPPPMKRRKKHPFVASRPVVQYDFISYDRRLGFDICTDAGLVAAVDATRKIQLYSLHNGRKIKEFSPALDSSVPVNTFVNQLQFTVDGPWGALSRPQLVACCGIELIGYQW